MLRTTAVLNPQSFTTVQAPDPLKRFKTLADAQAMQQESELRGLQIQNARGDLEAQDAAHKQAAAIVETLGKYGGDFQKAFDSGELTSVSPQFAMSVGKQLSDQKREDAKQRESELVHGSEALDRRLRREAEASKPTILSPGQSAWDPTGKLRFSAPATPKVENLTLDEKIAQSWLDANPGKSLVDFQRYQNDEKARIARENRADPESVVNYIGDDGQPAIGIRTRGTTGITPLMGPDGKQARPASSSQNKPPSEGERNALRFYERMKGAAEDLAKLETVISAKGVGGQAWMNWAPNLMQPEENQLYQQAQRAFTEARLRKDSGAAIPEQEFANDRRMYFAQPGDTKAVIEQKAKSRNTAMDAIMRSAGRAYEETYGEMPAKLSGQKTPSSGGSLIVPGGALEKLLEGK